MARSPGRLHRECPDRRWLLEAGVAVVTPNKIAFSGSQADYTRLSVAARTTSAGKSVPAILSTMRRLRAAGDSLAVHRCRSLGYARPCADPHSGRRQPAQALTEAVQQGLAEPDPAGASLSGADVRRKLAIMLP
ncbi:MAG: hypothetical protein R3F18_06805 [Lysobacterales bacterium]